MKKAEYYINVKSDMVSQSEMQYPKVSGYVEEIIDSNGKKFKIGYHKNGYNSWVATELSTGLNCNTLIGCTTRAECVDNVHKNIDVIAKAFEHSVSSGEWAEKYIKPFRQFVDLKEFISN